MQSAINLQLSQISHGKVLVYDATNIENVVVGYRPAMIKLFLPATPTVVNASWYDWMTDDVVPGMVVNDKGFTVAKATYETGFLFEAYGSMGKDYKLYMNPDAVAGDSAMPPIVKIMAIISPAFTTTALNNKVVMTLTGGKFKAGTIIAADFTFAGDNAAALAAGTFTRTSDTVVTITALTLAAATNNTVTVHAATMVTQATSVAAVASTV